MRIPAQLHPQPRGGGGGQVGRHRQRRAPVERERRHQHPPVPDRQQLRHPGLFLLQQQANRIPRRVRGELRGDSSGAAARASFPRASRSARLSCSAAGARARPPPELARPTFLSAPHPQSSPAWPPLPSRTISVTGSPPSGPFTLRSPSRHHSTARHGELQPSRSGESRPSISRRGCLGPVQPTSAAAQSRGKAKYAQCAAAGLPEIQIHDLRQTGNQFTANAGANTGELMVRMGHYSERAALIYLHSSDARHGLWPTRWLRLPGPSWHSPRRPRRRTDLARGRHGVAMTHRNTRAGELVTGGEVFTLGLACPYGG